MSKINVLQIRGHSFPYPENAFIISKYARSGVAIYGLWTSVTPKHAITLSDVASSVLALQVCRA